MKKRLVSLALVGVVALTTLFAGCGGFSGNKSNNEKKDGVVDQTLNISVSGDIPTFDPALCQDDQSSFMLTQMYEGLTKVNKEGTADLSHAKEIKKNEDASVYTFILRDDIKWANGDPITAFDYEYSWLRVLDPKTASAQAEKFYDIKGAEEFNEGKGKREDVGIKAIDEKTLEVTLKAPHVFYDQIVTYPNFYPVNSKAVKADEQVAKDPLKAIVSGPFKVTANDLGKQIILEKNDKYNEANEVKLNKVNVKVVKDEATLYQLYKNNEIDFILAPANSISSDHFDEVMKSPEFKRFPISGIYWYKTNVEKKYLNNVHFRKALNLSINRQAIIDYIVKVGKPATGYVPGEKEVFFKDNDLEEAKKEMAIAMKEMNITDPSSIKITISYNTNEGHQKIAQAIQEQWKKGLGINTELKNEEWKVYLATTLKNSAFEVARLGWIADVDDPSDFLKYYADKDGGENQTRWSNPKFKELIVKANKEVDREKRLAYLKEAEQVMIDEVPVLPIYFQERAGIIHDNVEGVDLTPLATLYLKNVSKK